jgi:hypothetical protein
VSYPGLTPSETDLRRIVAVVIGVLAGKLNATTSVTLDANATTTTLTDSRIGGGSFFAFSPRSVSAVDGMATLYVSAKDKGTATLTHDSTTDVDRTYDVLIIG